jgi:hypothetical protein
MSRIQEPHLHLEVGHILFLDIVGYSKLLADEQNELVQELNQIFSIMPKLSIGKRWRGIRVLPLRTRDSLTAD